jgi:hypothetical protein
MFTRGGSGRLSSSTSGSNRSASLREIDEEATILEDEADDSGRGEVYVAVGKDVKDGRSNLFWAARNLLAGDLKLVLLHVHQPAERIMTGKINQLCFSFTLYLICINSGEERISSYSC